MSDAGRLFARAMMSKLRKHGVNQPAVEPAAGGRADIAATSMAHSKGVTMGMYMPGLERSDTVEVKTLNHSPTMFFKIEVLIKNKTRVFVEVIQRSVI